MRDLITCLITNGGYPGFLSCMMGLIAKETHPHGAICEDLACSLHESVSTSPDFTFDDKVGYAPLTQE